MEREILILLLSLTASGMGGEVKYTLNFKKSDLIFEKIKGYDLVRLKGYGYTERVGAPLLPKATVRILIPPGSEITKVEMISEEREELPGEYLIYPKQPPIPIVLSHKPPPWVEPDKKFYSKPYPFKIVEKSHTGNMGGYRIAAIFIYPLRYIPLKKRLVFYSRVRFKITYKEKVYSIPLTTFTQRRIFKDIVKGIVVNPQDAERWSPPLSHKLGSLQLPPDTVEYVVITSSSLASAFQPLVEWKTKKGVPARIVTLDFIYANYSGVDNAERIRNFIIDAHQSWGTVWVLLGGQCDFENSQEIVPRRDVYYYTSDEGYYPDEDTIPSDLYYSDLDGNWNFDGDGVWGEGGDSVDLYSDLFVGRAPCLDTQDVSRFVNKVLTYEKNPPLGYQRKILLPTGHLFSGYDETQSQEAIANMTPASWQDSRLYEEYGNLSEAAVVDSLNSGFGFVHHVAHGNEYGVYTYNSGVYLNISDVDGLSNGDMLSIHNAISCMTGAVDYVSGGDCFAEHFLTAPYAGVAAIMNSRYGWGDPPYMGPSELIDTSFYHQVFLGAYPSHYHLGVAHALSKDAYVAQVTWYGVWAWCIYELNLFGDPEMPLWTDIPDSMMVNHPSTIALGPHSFTVTVQDRMGSSIEGALVCLMEDTLVYARGYTDASGSLTLNISPLPGTLWVTVTAHNYLPYEGYALCLPAGAYVAYQKHSIDDDTMGGSWGNGDGIVDAGETIELNLWVENYGNQSASGVEGVVSTNDPFITITDSLKNYGDILAGDSIQSPSPYIFTVNPDVPDQHWTTFDLSCRDISDSLWVSHFNILVRHFSTISGYIKEMAGDTGIPYAILTYTGPLSGIDTADSYGYYEISGLPGGSYTLIASAEGLFPETAYVNLPPDTSVDFILKAPDIEVVPETLGVALDIKDTTSQVMKIYNRGTDTLNFNISEANISLVRLRVGGSRTQMFNSPNINRASSDRRPKVSKPMISREGIPFAGVIFSDDMESGVNGWTTIDYSGGGDLWHQITSHLYVSPSYHSPTHSWWCGIDAQGNYDNGFTIINGLISPNIYIPGSCDSVTLSFWEYYDTEGGYDLVNVDISTDGGNSWTPLRSGVSGVSNGWEETSFDITNYKGKVVNIRFYFNTQDNISNNYYGWFIDDVKITASGYVDWLTEDPTQGTVPPGDSMDIIVSYNPVELKPDSIYKEWLKIKSNDPDEPMTSVLCTLKVRADYYVEVTPKYQDSTGFMGDTLSYRINIRNLGENTDSYDLLASDNSWTTTFWDSTGTTQITNTGNVPSGSSVNVIVKVEIPGSANSGDEDTVNISVKSMVDPTVSDQVRIKTKAMVMYSIPFEDGFEEGLGKWFLSGTNNWAVYTGTGEYGTGGAYEGDSVMVMTNSDWGYSYSYADLYLLLWGKSGVVLDYYWRTWGLYNPEGVWLDIYDGEWHLGVDSLTGYDTDWQHKRIDLSGYNMIDGFIIRFRGYTYNREEYEAVYIDRVRVYIPEFGSIAGTVRDASTLLPIQDAVVEAESTALSDTTDASGRYQIDRIEIGTYNITCRATGYLPKTAYNVSIMANDTVTLDFFMTAPDIEVEPDTLGVVLNVGDTTSQTMVIGNTGDDTLRFNISESPLSFTSSKLIALKSINSKIALSLKKRGLSIEKKRLKEAKTILGKRDKREISIKESRPLVGTYTGDYLSFGLSDYGEVMPFQYPVGTEHLQVWDYISGYTIGYNDGVDNIEWAGYSTHSGIVSVSYDEVVNNSDSIVVDVITKTSGGQIQLSQRFTFNKHDKFIRVRTRIKNLTKSELKDVIFKPFANWDMDNDYRDDNWDYDSTYYMVYAWDEHYAAIAGALPPDYRDIYGWDDYYKRETDEDYPNGPVTHFDGLEILHYELGSLSPGEERTLYFAYGVGDNLSELREVIARAMDIVSWVSENPVSGTLPPIDTAQVTVFYNASDLLPDSIYRVWIRVNSNDPDEPNIPVLCTLAVIADYYVELTPKSCDSLGFTGDTAWYRLNIRNRGLNTDSYDLSVSDNSWSTTFWDQTGTNQITNTGNVSPGSSIDVIVKVKIPETASNNEIDTAVIHARSTTNPLVSDSGEVRTRARMMYSIPFEDGFEEGVDKWFLTGANNWTIYAGTGEYGTGGAYEGDSVMVMTCSIEGIYSYSYADLYLKLSGESNVILDCYWRTWSLYSPEGVWLDIYDGEWHYGVDSLTGKDTDWQHNRTDLSGYNMIDGFIIRFRSYMDYTEDLDAVYIDKVKVFSPELGSVTGTVRDATTSSPIQGAIVEVEGTGLLDTTDASGEYQIDGIEVGTYDITCNASGYPPKTVYDISIIANDTVTVDFLMGKPEIEVKPDSLGAILVLDDSTSQIMRIENKGDDTLVFKITESLSSGLKVKILPFSSKGGLSNILNEGAPNKKGIPPALISPLQNRITSHCRPSKGIINQKPLSGSVLILKDGATESDVESILTDAGFDVTVSDVLEYNWDGTNPSPSGYGAVILLDGETWEYGMPESGQLALVDYVQNGGGLILTEWIAYEVSQVRYSSMTDLIPLTRTGGGSSPGEVYTVVKEHPVTEGLPSSFSIPQCGYNIGYANSGTVVVTGGYCGDAVAVKNYGSGHIVHFAMAGNYEGYNPWNDEMQKLLVNAVLWVCGGIPWLSETPTSGTVPPKDSIDILISYNSSGLKQDSVYKAWLKIRSNDPDDSILSIPVTLTVLDRDDPPVVSGLPDTSLFEDDSLMFDLDDYVEDPDDPDSLLTWAYSVYGFSEEGIAFSISKGLNPIAIKTIGKSLYTREVSSYKVVLRSKLIHSIKALEYKGRLPVILEDSPIHIRIDSITHIATITTDPNWNGNFNLIFTATDPYGLSDSDTMAVEVIPVNDPPEIIKWGPPSPDTVEAENSIELWVNARDPDNDPLAYEWSINGIIDNSAKDTFYLYKPDKPGIDTVEVVVSDYELADSVKWIIIVQPKGIEESYQKLPRFFSLSQNSPNPFEGSTEISYTIALRGSPTDKSYVRLEIYDITGKLIRKLINQPQTPGYYKIRWDGRDKNRRGVPAGIYFYRLKVDSKIIGTKKLILLR